MDELDEPEGYVAKDLCIFTKEVGLNPDGTVMNENRIYNGTWMSKGVLICKCFVHRYYLGVQKSQQSHLQNRKVVLSKIVPEEILK